MFAFPDQFVAMHRQSLESAHAIALASFAGFEKLTQLNVQAAKASFEEGVQKGVSLLDTKDAKGLAESFADSAQPASDKFTAYAKHVYVDRKSRKPVPLPSPLRAALELLGGE